MSLVRVHNFSVSLDGYGTGEGQSLEAPFGHAHGKLLDRAVQRVRRQLLGLDLEDEVARRHHASPPSEATALSGASSSSAGSVFGVMRSM